MSSFLKKAKFHLQLWSGIWSLPLGMFTFIGAGIALQHFFSNPGDPEGAPGFYDPSFIQAAFYASAMQVFMDVAIWLGYYFTARHVFHYYTGHLDQDGKVVNPSKDDFDKLKGWQKLCWLGGMYLVFSGQWLFLFWMLK